MIVLGTMKRSIMLGIGKEWWILYSILIIFGVAKLYWKIGAIKAYDEIYSLLKEIQNDLNQS